MHTKSNIEVTAADKRFKHLTASIRKATETLLHKTKNEGAHIDIYLVGDDFMRKNVLAFPSPKGFPRPDIKGKSLGEIFLNPGYIKAKEEDLSFMLVHGFLHLLGYGHDKSGDTIRMEAKEKELRNQIL